MPKVYVVDTNIILDNLDHLKKISQDGQNIIAIPDTVLIELEEFKKNPTELGFVAREFARMIADSTDIGTDESNGFTVVKYQHNGGTEIHIISKDFYDCDINMHHIQESNDKRIVEACVAAGVYYHEYKVIFLSIDVYARTFAKLKRVLTETLHDDKKDLPDFRYWKSIEIDEDVVLENKEIALLDRNRDGETRSYEFVRPSGRKDYAIIGNGLISLINEEEDFKGLAVKPSNIKQKFLAKALLSPYFDTYVVDARAGSGKTLLAISAAMKLMDVYRGNGNTVYQKIVYVRNSVESLDKGEDVGYLAGNDEKFRIYNMPLRDTLEYIARKGIKTKDKTEEEEKALIEEKIEKLITKYNITTLWPGEARGRTLDDAIVILDEWQNASNKTSQLVISRLTSTCKLIVIGSNRQIDNLYLNRYNNGLTFLLKLAQKQNEHLKFFSIDMEKSVRGKYAQFADEVF